MRLQPLIQGILTAGLLALAGHAALSQSLSSLKLTDTVVSKGSGDINLFKDVNGPQLEAFRSANGGRLIFAVDVNEASNGFETSTSQGVTVEAAWIEAVFPGSASPRIYASYSTETRALVAPSGSNTRAYRYTVLGDAGSSRLSPSGSIGGQYFDSTLKVTVPDDLTNATSVTLKVRLLSVNDKLGEPDSYYDVSGGFEDLALLTPADAAYLDEVLPLESGFRQGAPAMELSPEGLASQQALLARATNTQQQESTNAAGTSLSWVALPAAGAFQVLAYEDLIPRRGDYDFNDAVIGYRYSLGLNTAGQVVRIEGEAALVARGSNYTHNWTLELPLPNGGSASVRQCSTVNSAGGAARCDLSVSAGRLRWTAFKDSRNILPVTDASRPQRNTFAGQAPLQGPRATFTLTFDSPVPLASIGAPDPALHVIDTQQTVRNDSRDASGYPFVLTVPSGWHVPIENMDVGLAYPGLMSYLQSGGSTNTNWYQLPSSGRVVGWSAQP